jgi:hypothetical protein
MAFSTMLILPIHKRGRSFHLLMSSSISSFSDLLFLLNKSLISFVKFIPRNCAIFEAMVNEVFSLICFLVYAFLVYGKAAVC